MCWLRSYYNHDDAFGTFGSLGPPNFNIPVIHQFSYSKRVFYEKLLFFFRENWYVNKLITAI